MIRNSAKTYATNLNYATLTPTGALGEWNFLARTAEFKHQRLTGIMGYSEPMVLNTGLLILESYNETALNRILENQAEDQTVFQYDTFSLGRHSRTITPVVALSVPGGQPASTHAGVNRIVLNFEFRSDL